MGCNGGPRQTSASAELTVGGGIGANMLVGGSFRTVELRSRFRSRLG
jgi:hypothetical protein